MQKPQVLLYTDYRLFLADMVSYLKKTFPRWSYGTWARSLKLSSKSTMLMIIRGQRNPGPLLIEKLCDYFEFTVEERKYFSSLVKVQKKTTDPVFRLLLLEAEQASQSKPSTSLWLALLIRELLTLFPYGLEWPQLQSLLKLQNDTFEKIHSTLQWMHKENWITQDGTAWKVKLQPSSQPQNQSELQIEAFHKEACDAAISAQKITPKNERTFHMSFLRVKKDHLEEAHRLFQKFQSDLTQKLDSQEGDAIFQVNLHFFPVTEARKDSTIKE